MLLHASLRLALLLAVLASAGTAQFDAQTWSLTPCAAQVSGDRLVLEACLDPCQDEYVTARMLAPTPGTYVMDFDWFADQDCCVQFGVARMLDSTHEADASLFSFGGAFGPSWCDPEPPPCAGSGQIALFTDGKDLLFVLDAQETGCGFGLQADTRVTLGNLVHVPALLAPVVESTSGKPAHVASTVTVYGQLFEGDLDVVYPRLDSGVESSPQSNSIVVDDVSAGTPGFHPVVVTTAAGSTRLPDGLELWPSLRVITGEASFLIELDARAFDSPYGLMVGLGATNVPVPLGDVTWYGLRIDLGRPWLLFDVGTMPGAEPLFTSFPIPSVPGLIGLPLHFQGITETTTFPSGTPYQYSFTNLETVLIQ